MWLVADAFDGGAGGVAGDADVARMEGNMVVVIFVGGDCRGG